MRVRFDEVFHSNPDGSFTPGVSFSGVDIAKYAGHDLDVEKLPDGTIEIKPIFK